MREPVLNRSFAISVLLHAGLVGLLLLLARPSLSPDRPLRVRILEPPPVAGAPGTQGVAPQPVPRPAPKALPPPPPRSMSSERSSRDDRLTRPEPPAAAPPLIATPPRPVPAPEPPPAASTPPQVASRPAPEAASPPAEFGREPLQERVQPDRSGLSLGAPVPEAPGSGTGSGSPRAGSARPSFRDQIAGLGSGLTADSGGLARETVPLDSSEPRFSDYLARLKRRIEREWTYPEEARRVGMAGELILVFTLNRSGTLTHIQLVRGSGFPALDNEALRAVKTAAPYDPFPRQMGDEPKNISATFRYQSLNYYRRN
jgi:TonB family protein